MSQPHHADLLVVGGGVAAVRCVRGLRRGGFAGTILLIGEERLAPYNRPPLSKELLLSAKPLPDELLLAESPAWYERHGVELRSGHAVTSLDLDARHVVLDDATSIAFDRCVLATGAVARPLRVPGGESARTLRTVVDARRLSAVMGRHHGEPVVIVGGGFIGLEVATALVARGLRPTVVELAPTLWGGALGAELGEWARDRITAMGVTVRSGAAITALNDDSAWIGDERLPARFVVAGVGVAPRDELARRAGLGVDDGILVDRGGRTSHPAVWAAGDVARVDGLRVEHWHAAREGGERVAASLLGAEPAPPRAPWVFSELAGTTLDLFGVATGWDEERWLADGAVLAYLVAERVVQLASIGGRLAPEDGRRIVEQGATVGDLERLLAATRIGA